MSHPKLVAVVFLLAVAVVQASQCSSNNDKPQNGVSLLQQKLQTNVIKDATGHLIFEVPGEFVEIHGEVGPCSVQIQSPSQKVHGLNKWIQFASIRQALDTKIIECLKQKNEKATVGMLFQAVAPGYTKSSQWLSEQGADPFTPLDNTFLSQLQRQPRTKHSPSMLQKFFQVRMWKGLSGKNAVQIAISGGYSDIVQMWARSDTIIDSWGRSLYSYILPGGGAILPDAAVSDLGISAEHIVTNVTRGGQKRQCRGSMGKRGWNMKSADEPYMKCDFAVSGNLTREDYLKSYYSLGRPVLLRDFIAPEDLCLMERWRLMELYGNETYQMGPIAYPELFGLTRCGDYSLAEAEHSVYCAAFPGVSNYHAEHIASNDEPFRLATSRTFAKLASILDIKSEQMHSIQYFFGGDKSGAALHLHGAAINLLYVGTKDWYILPPQHAAASGIPAYDLWHTAGIHTEHVVRCTQQAGDLLLLPDFWSHSTVSHGFTAGLGILYSNRQSAQVTT